MCVWFAVREVARGCAGVVCARGVRVVGAVVCRAVLLVGISMSCGVSKFVVESVVTAESPFFLPGSAVMFGGRSEPAMWRQLPVRENAKDLVSSIGQ